MEKIGYQAEKAFQDYLDNNNILYWYIQQDVKTFSSKLKKLDVRRPDFFILLPNLGFILVDVEHNIPLKKYGKFCICDNKLRKYNNLQKYFNMQVWFAFSNEEIHYTTWYFIPVSKVLKYRSTYLVKEKEYVSMPLSEFVQISNRDNFMKVFI